MTRILLAITVLAFAATAFAGEDCCPAPEAAAKHECDSASGQCDMHNTEACPATTAQQPGSAQLILAQQQQQQIPEGHL